MGAGSGSTKLISLVWLHENDGEDRIWAASAIKRRDRPVEKLEVLVWAGRKRKRELQSGWELQKVSTEEKRKNVEVVKHINWSDEFTKDYWHLLFMIYVQDVKSGKYWRQIAVHNCWICNGNLLGKIGRKFICKLQNIQPFRGVYFWPSKEFTKTDSRFWSFHVVVCCYINKK